MTSTIGRNLRRIRMDLGYSQAQVAKLARMSQSWICKIERGNENPTLECMGRIAGALRVEASDLLRESAGEIS